MTREIQTIRSGSLVAINNIVGTAVTLVSALLLSKALGPQEFAIYAYCTSLTGFLRSLSRLGVNASLLTQKEEPQASDYHTALAAMLICSVVVACAACMALPWLGQFSRIPRLLWPGVATAAFLPLHVLSLPALTRLERQLKFKPVVIMELVGQVIGQLFGITLAFYGWGIWGPLTGWGVRAIFQATIPWIVVGMIPQMNWDFKNAKRMIKYGVGYVLTTSIAQSRNLVFLAIVGRILGQDAVGLMGLTLRAAGLAAPFRTAVARVILPAIAPIAHIPNALKEKIKATVEMELLLSIPVFVLAVAIYPFAVEHTLGPSWQATVKLFPWIAAGSILASAHAASLSALHVKGFFRESIAATLIGYVALALALAVLGGIMGLEGCAAATVVVWPASWAIEWFSSRRLGTRWSTRGVGWAIGGAMTCLAWQFGPWALVPPIVIGTVTRAAIKSRLNEILTAIQT